MTSIEAVLKYVVGRLGIPVVSASLAYTLAANKMLKYTTESIMILSAKSQMLGSEDRMTKRIDILFKSSGEYGSDRAYFLIDNLDGALKILAANKSGDLYHIKLKDCDRGCEYFVFSRFGWHSEFISKDVVVLSHLPKRGETIDGDRMVKFLEPVVASILRQQEAIAAIEAAGARPN